MGTMLDKYYVAGNREEAKKAFKKYYNRRKMKHKILNNEIGQKIGVGQQYFIKESKDSYYISYAVNVNTSLTRDETALVVQDNYFILNGNHIKEYAKRNKEEQIKYFLEKSKTQVGFWSENPEKLKDLIKK